MTIRLAVIGAGVMGADHARIVAEDLPGAALQVICDADAARARGVAEALGAQDVATDAKAVIARADVDAVIVASPDATHAPLALAALAAGKPALVEKPLSQDLDACLDVVRAEAALDRRLLQLGFMRRFDPAYVEMKQSLDSGILGAALMMHNLHRNVDTPATGFTAAMAITNSAPHEFDIVRHVLGAEIARISAYRPRRKGDLAPPVVMVLETDAGQVVTVEVNNNAAYGYDVRGEVVGERGAVSLAPPVHSRLDLGLRQSAGYAADWRPRFAEAYRQQNRAFLRFVRTGIFPAGAADAWDGYAAAAIAAAGVRALDSGPPVAVELAERPALYAASR